MGADFTVLIHDGTERAKNFMEVFGRLRVNVVSFIPTMINVPGFDEPQSAYMLDLEMITQAERVRLVNHLSARFAIATSEVDQLLDSMGMPILASDCTITVEHPQRWIDDLGGVPDYDGDEDLDYDYDRDDDFENALSNCAMTDDGFCGHAGSEYCDWECPIGRLYPFSEMDEIAEDEMTTLVGDEGGNSAADEIPF